MEKKIVSRNEIWDLIKDTLGLPDDLRIKRLQLDCPFDGITEVKIEYILEMSSKQQKQLQYIIGHYKLVFIENEKMAI